ncbi:MAG: MerR family transcriptional regulator [Agromyces sp.]
MSTLSITEVTRITGVSSRTLRHYEAIGLLPSIRAANDYRMYDEAALVRLQRILVLRELGVSLARIASVLDAEREPAEALREHAHELRAHRARLTRQIAAVERAATALENGESIMDAEPFDGFDHRQYREEVTEKWGADAYASGDRWWRGMSESDRGAWKERSDDLLADWRAVAESGVDPTGAIGQALAARQADWLRAIPGTPSGPSELPAYLRGLGEMYVADERFSANYGGQTGAEFVRAALAAFADSLDAG